MIKLLSRYFSACSLFLLGTEALLIVSVMWAALAWQRASLGVPADHVFGMIAVAALCQLSLYSHDLYVRSRTTPTRS